jgi:hypothetical protein
MASGIVGVFTGSGSIAYTPSTVAKVKINASCTGTSGSFLLNGASVLPPGTSGAVNLNMEVYVGAGQTLTLSTTTMNIVVSSIEE